MKGEKSSALKNVQKHDKEEEEEEEEAIFV